jgi:hypothetical protein
MQLSPLHWRGAFCAIYSPGRPRERRRSCGCPVEPVSCPDVNVELRGLNSALNAARPAIDPGNRMQYTNGMRKLLAGIATTTVFWIAAWGHFPIVSEYSFLPLWLGYICLINGLGEVFLGTSLMERMGAHFFWLFVLSVPMWWFFERVNAIVQNWHYEFVEPISDLHYFVQASLDFSTVIPAVLSTGFLFFMILRDRISHWKLRPVQVRKSYVFLVLLAGLASFFLLPLFPHETFPLVWVAPILILEPIAYSTGSPCILRLIERGEWALPISTMIATLFTGFWWEFWNYYSLPKWYYTIPYVGFWKIFEMPVLGYFGYPFFGLAILSYISIISHPFFKRDVADYFH